MTTHLRSGLLLHEVLPDKDVAHLNPGRRGTGRVCDMILSVTRAHAQSAAAGRCLRPPAGPRLPWELGSRAGVRTGTLIFTLQAAGLCEPLSPAEVVAIVILRTKTHDGVRQTGARAHA